MPEIITQNVRSDALRSKDGCRIQSRITMRESHKDQHQVLSTVPRVQPSRIITSIDPQQFIYGLSMNRSEVESHRFDEKVCLDRYWITLAHFSDDYEMAQCNSAVFLQGIEYLAADIDPLARRHAEGVSNVNLGHEPYCRYLLSETSQRHCQRGRQRWKALQGSGGY